jgi:thioredoxin 1
MRTRLVAALAVTGALVLAGCGASDSTSTDSAAPMDSTAPATTSPSADPATGTAGSMKDSAAQQTEAAPGTPQAAATSGQAKSKKRTAAPKPTTAPEPAAGRYVEYDEYSATPAAFSGSDVVLFFHAAWCPKCQDTEESIENDGVPAGLTIVKVDFDSATSLRQKYGVTLQHTYVQVDPSGAALTKWTGTYGDTSVAGIASKTV